MQGQRTDPEGDSILRTTGACAACPAGKRIPGLFFGRCRKAQADRIVAVAGIVLGPGPNRFGGTGRAKKAARQLHIEASEAQERLDLLDSLVADGNFDHAKQCLEALESKRSIMSRLLACFPGSYGQYLSLHFGGFLNEPITTPAQQTAFDNVIGFLDSVDFSLPQDLLEMLDTASRTFDADFVSYQDAHIRQLAADPARYIDDHRQALDAYMDYMRSAEYRASPVYRLRKALTDFTLQSGYRDIFLPAMRQLSPRYDDYCRNLDTANAFFLTQYPDADKILTP